MKLIIKLLSIMALSSLLLGSNMDDKILNFIKKSITSKDGLKIKSIKLNSSQDLKEIPNWRVYYVDISANMSGEDTTITQVLFSDGKYISQDFINLDDGGHLRDEVGPNAKNSLYDSSHLIAGHKNAKNRLLLFSDPNCPFCQTFVPFAIEAAKKYPNEFALYYYDFPLNIHASAKGYTKAMLVAQKQGVKDVVLRTYKARFRSSSSDESKIVKKFNDMLKTDITVEQMNESWVIKKIENDELIAKKMLVNGTPTLYVNDKKDPKRLNFKALYDKLEKK